MNRTSPYAIQVDNLSKAYADKTVLNQMTLCVEPGQFVALLGPNGSGKSTLLKILCTLIKPTHGTAFVNGYSITASPVKVRDSLGFVFQSVPLDKQQTVMDNLLFCAALFGISKKEASLRISFLLEIFKLKEYSTMQVKHLSGGMQRTIDIIRSLIHKPPVLLLDEPTAGLDNEHRKQLFTHLHDLQKANPVTILFTTHHFEEAQVCNQIFLMKEGKAMLGNKNDIHSR